MKKKTMMILLPLLLLTSCGSTYQTIMPYKVNDIEDSRIAVKLNYSDTMKDGYELKGTFTAQKNAVLTDATTLSFSDNDPLFSTSFSEKILVTFRKQDLTLKEDGSISLDFSVKFEHLENYFEKTEKETKKNYFFLHGLDFDRTKPNTYATHPIDYTFDGTKVKIVS